MPTLAQHLGTTVPLSPLLRKAHRLGLSSVRDLEILSVQRGCDYYRRDCTVKTKAAFPEISRAEFSDEELAIALLHTGWEWDPHLIRLGAAMLNAPDNDPRHLARLAIMERCENVVRYIAEAGKKFEPNHPFWSQLLHNLPPSPAPKTGVLPHPTRFVAMTGITRRGRETIVEWIRPTSANG